MIMLDLRNKYDGLLEVMREGFKQEDGSELTFQSEEFAGRLTGLMCLFMTYGVTGEGDFKEILGDDWTWEHYHKVLAKLQELGVVDEFDMAISPECERVIEELKLLTEDKFYV